MSNSNGMYNVLNIFKKLEPTQEQQIKAEAKAIYESVEAKGSVLEGVKSVESNLAEKFQAFKEDAYSSIGHKKYGKKAFSKIGEDDQVDEMFAFGVKPGKDRGPRDTGRGDELSRRQKVLGKNPMAKGSPYSKEYKEKGKYGNQYDVAGPKGVLPEGEREGNPTIPGTDKKAQSRYNPTNKPAPVKKLDKPTDKFDKIKNEVAPPGKKAEKMVKSIKAGYANDGKLTDKEKGIAYATAWKAHKAGKVEESRKRRIAEGINFAEMMKETDSGIAEMLGEIQADIDSFKKTGHCSDKLEAFLKVHNHGKRLMGEAVPKGPSFAPQDAMALAKPTTPFEPSRIQGKPSMLDRAKNAASSVASGINKAIGHGSDEDLLKDLHNKSTFEDAELNELAKLAGLQVAESNDGNLANNTKPYDKVTKGDVVAGRLGKDEMGGKKAVDEADMEEGNEFSGELAKAKAAGKTEFSVDGKSYKVTEAQLVDCGDMSPIGSSAASMESQQGRINVSTNMSSDGSKSVSINADGEAADQLVQMLKMAGLGGNAKASHTEAPVEISVSGDQEVDEATAEYSNVPKEEYEGIDAIINQGDDMNRQKKQFANMPKAGDNPMATEKLESIDPRASFGRDLMAEYQAMKLRK